MDTYIFLKFEEECEVLYSGRYAIPHSPVDLSLQLKQLLSYFDRHPDLDMCLLNLYVQRVCEIFEGNTKYIENAQYDWGRWYRYGIYKYIQM